MRNRKHMLHRRRRVSEALKSDYAFDAKKDMLIEKIRKYRQLREELADIDEVAKTANNDIKEILTKMKTHSIIVDGVLVEVYDAYMSNSFAYSKFFKSIDENVDTLGQDLKDMVDKYREIHTYESNFRQRRTLKNPKNRPDGDITMQPTSEAFGDRIRNIWNRIKNWAKRFFVRAEENVERIKKEFEMIGLIGNNTGVLEHIRRDRNVVRNIKKKIYENRTTYKYYNLDKRRRRRILEARTAAMKAGHREVDNLIKGNIKQWIGNSKFKQKIVDVLSTTQNAYLRDTHVYESTQSLSATCYYLNELIYNGIVVKKRNESDRRRYTYNLTQAGVQFFNDADINVTVEGVASDATEGTTPYNPENPQKMEFDKTYLGEALEIAREAIKIDEMKKKLTTQEKQIREEMLNLFDDLKILDVVVDDKIEKIYHQSRQNLNIVEFRKDMTTVENVGEDIATLMNELIAEFTSEYETSGSVRYFADDSGSEDGELGAHFDHETKTVVTREGKINEENIFKRFFNWVKGFINKIRNLTKSVEKRLATI